MKNSLKEQDVTILNPLGDENQLNDNIKKLASQLSETINLVNNTFNTFMNSSMIELLENNNQKLNQLNKKAENLRDILENIRSKSNKIEDIIHGILWDEMENNITLTEGQKKYYKEKSSDCDKLHDITNNKTIHVKLNIMEHVTYEISSKIDDIDEDGILPKIISNM